MATIDHVFGGSPPSWDSPATNAVAVTPHDSTNLTNPARALYIGTGGSVTGVLWGGQTVTFANIPDGTILPVAFTRVNATHTDADDIVALY